VAIFLSLASVVPVVFLLRRLLGFPERLPIGTVVGLLGPATLIFVIGLYDDLRGLGPYSKFSFQILAGTLLYLAGFGIQNVDLLFPWHAVQGFVAFALTIFWVLLITNAFNLIDGLDGLAAGSALFSTLVIFVISLFTANRFVSFLAVMLAGATLGFLRFNFNPATIFLGDSGSLFIGFMLSALALAGSQKAPTMVAVAVPVVSCGLPILDVAIAVARRFLSGKPLFRGDHEHIHHKLLKRGLSHRTAVFTLYGVSAGFGLLSLTLLHSGRTIALVLVVIGTGVCIGLQQLRYHELSELRRVIQRAVNQKRIVANDLNIWRATEALHSCPDLQELCRVLTGTLQPLGFDGFSLKLPFDVRFPNTLPAPLSRDGEGRLYCSWTIKDFSEPAWELRFELTDSTGDGCGFFSVYKRSVGPPLLMDINLLTAGFQAAVADAVQRTITQFRNVGENYEELTTQRTARAASASSGLK
jgi:UDP-GlcNAc:undecaprenyl-phosphate GlcNAc-1-phosphate transferase